MAVNNVSWSPDQGHSRPANRHTRRSLNHINTRTMRQWEPGTRAYWVAKLAGKEPPARRPAKVCACRVPPSRVTSKARPRRIRSRARARTNASAKVSSGDSSGASTAGSDDPADPSGTSQGVASASAPKTYEYDPAVDDWPPAYIPTSMFAFRQGTRARRAGLERKDCPYTKPKTKDMRKALDWLGGFECGPALPRVDDGEAA